jgi:hypothetical protein
MKDINKSSLAKHAKTMFVLELYRMYKKEFVLCYNTIAIQIESNSNYPKFTTEWKDNYVLRNGWLWLIIRCEII